MKEDFITLTSCLTFVNVGSNDNNKHDNNEKIDQRHIFQGISVLVDTGGSVCGTVRVVVRLRRLKSLDIGHVFTDRTCHI